MICRRTLKMGSVLVLLCGAATPTCRAEQQGGGGNGNGGGPPLFLPGPLAAAVFDAPVLAGDFAGAGEVDGMVLDAGEPVLLLRPEVYATRLGAGVSANDLALWRADGDDRDSVLAIGPAGLTVLRFEGDPGALSGETLALAGWANGRKVRTGDVIGSDSVDAVGLADAAVDDRLVLIASGGAGGLTTEAGFQTFNSAYDLELLDFDGDGKDEVAALTTYGVEVFEVDGTPVAAMSWTLAPLIAAVLRTPAGTPDQLALITTLGNGSQWLLTFDTVGETGPWGLGALGIVRAVAGDLDDDGDPDLAFSVTTSNEVVTLVNTGSVAAALFDTAPVFVSHPFGDPARDPSSNGAGLALADFDHDGDLDILAPIQGDHPSGNVFSDIEVIRGTVEDESRLMVGVEASALVTETPGGDSRFETAFLPPLDPLAESGTRQLEITVWTTPSLSDPTQSEAYVSTTRIGLPTPETSIEERTFGFVSSINVVGEDILHTLVFRQVLVDGSDVVVARGPAVTAIQSPDHILEEVTLLPAKKQTLTTTIENNGGSSVPAGGLIIGPRLPGFEEEETPDEESVAGQ